MGSFISRLIKNIFKGKNVENRNIETTTLKDTRTRYATITLNSPEEFQYYINEIADWTYVIENNRYNPAIPN